MIPSIQPLHRPTLTLIKFYLFVLFLRSLAICHCLGLLLAIALQRRQRSPASTSDASHQQRRLAAGVAGGGRRLRLGYTKWLHLRRLDYTCVAWTTPAPATPPAGQQHASHTLAVATTSVASDR